MASILIAKRGIFSSSLRPLIHIPIAQRLTLFFLIPALIATSASVLIGTQSAQLLDQESAFYQNLFQSYSSLTTCNDFLQLMNFKLDETTSKPLAADQLKLNREAIQGLESRYDGLLSGYLKKSLLTHNPDQVELFDMAGHPGVAAQQQLLANSALRTWQLYRQTQQQILQHLQNGRYQDAVSLKQSQGEASFSDALSALRQLIQFDGRLVTYVQDATAMQERNVLITTVIAVVLILLSIGIIGALAYGTLVKRLHQLREVAQNVKQGKTDTRAIIDGQDEITAVSHSMNTMLDTIVGLLEKTQVQRDALVQAAERLFSDMRLANNGELDIRTAVHNDPIGMLGRAFSFTIGRFQRFLLRNHTTIEQLEVISQRNLEHARSFLAHTHTLLHSIRQSQSSLAQESGSRGVYEKLQDRADGDHVELLTQATKIQQYLQQTLHHDIEQRTFLFLSQVERAHHLCRQVESELQTHSGVITASSVHGLRSLETQLKGLRQETQTFKKKTSENLTEMDARINHLLSVARTESAHTSHLTVAQVQELTRLAERFYQDVTALAQSLHGITQEMRTNLAPFRLAAIGKG